MSDTIILIVDDLMFLPKLENGLRHLGYQPVAATNEADLTLALSKSPVLIIVDLFSQSFDWVAPIRLCRESKATPVLGFGPHVDLSLRENAIAAGCDAVVGRGAIAGQLSHLVAKYKRASDIR